MCSGGTSLTLSLHNGLHRQLCTCLMEASGPLLLQGAKCLRVYPPQCRGVLLRASLADLQIVCLNCPTPAPCTASGTRGPTSAPCTLLSAFFLFYPHSAYTHIPHRASIPIHLPGHALHANDHPHSLTQSYTLLTNICIHTALWTSVMHIT